MIEFDIFVGSLNKKFENKIKLKDEKHVLFIEPEDWLAIAKELKNNKEYSFDYLMCISSYDLGDNNTYGVAYNFYSTVNEHYIEVRIEIDDNSSIPSVSKIWNTANWHEREAYDMMGINFEGHPDLKRILLSEDWDGHPLRKNYKEPDYYHGMPVPKDKSYWD